MAKQFILGSLVGAAVLAAVLGGVAVALGHPLPHIYKQIAKKNVKPTGIYWTLSPAGASDAGGVTTGITVSQAKQISDVLKAKVFQQGAGGAVLFVPAAPAATDVVDAADSSYYQVAL